MQAKLSQEGDVVVVRLMGRLDIEATGPFREACLTRLSGKKVVFDFRELSFVGSSGIVPFIEAVQTFAEAGAEGLSFSGVGSEFRKILAATALGAVAIFEDPLEAARVLAATPWQAAVLAPRVAGAGAEAESVFLDQAGSDVHASAANEAAPDAAPEGEAIAGQAPVA